jgi:hypothetical protein
VLVPWPGTGAGVRSVAAARASPRKGHGGAALVKAAGDPMPHRCVGARFSLTCVIRPADHPGVRGHDSARSARFTRWHGGLLAGSSTFLLGRADGIDWAVTFNKDAPGAGEEFVVMLDAPLHRVADQIRNWPTGDLYPTVSL